MSRPCKKLLLGHMSRLSLREWNCIFCFRERVKWQEKEDVFQGLIQYNANVFSSSMLMFHQNILCMQKWPRIDKAVFRSDQIQSMGKNYLQTKGSEVMYDCRAESLQMKKRTRLEPKMPLNKFLFIIVKYIGFFSQSPGTDQMRKGRE